MKIAILGFAGQGQSAYGYWDKPENDITICDSDANAPVPKGVKSQLGKDSLKNLDRFDLLIRTPVLHPRQILEANPDVPDILEKVWTNTNEFLEVCPTRNIIGVTGTKGKGTTSTLITRMLEAAGHRVHLGGNIGTPPLDMLSDGIQPDDWVVLELANFQLIDLKRSPHIAVCLMIEPEHLNWHADIDEYVEAKRQLFAHQAEDDIAIYYAKNNYSRAIAGSTKGLAIPYMSEPGAHVTDNASGEEHIMIDGHIICDLSDINLLGRHNWQNVCAAVTTIWNITQDTAAIRKTIAGFRGLPHRLEKVREVEGVRYYNDSFSSAPGATVAALDAVKGAKVLIVGGVDKGLDLDELARSMLMHKQELRRIIVIGEVAHKLEKELEAHGLNNYDILKNVTMSQIVERAQQAAHSGDSVILSPGTSSFDMFKNFEERGLQYKEAVNAL
ncbi:MAG TPA: UDP-N-acetylmuramoyl-L-alanine--D-glutamate ligase [Candidatus Limnocylindria bacterium]|nr:UDP-N-acetylmuramoyl-L-alanine--D-glutamate ligase [Candidatus Limnocylindria bacterium]